MTDPSQPPIDLSHLAGDLQSLNLGPGWARDDADGGGGSATPPAYRDYPDTETDRGRGPGRGRGRDDRQSRGRPGDRGPERDRRDERRGPGGRPPRGRDRHDGHRGHDDRSRSRAEPPAGVRLEIQPLNAAVDALAKEIIRSARCYPLFDVIRVLIGGRDRYRAVFTTAGAADEDRDQTPATLILDKATPALWLDRTEAMRQLWQAPWRHRFYREETIETDPPKGNFTGVARCTMSGQLLGPPNHHAYQDNLLRLHRERFAHLPLEDYRRRVRIERDEATINEWLDQMRQRRVWHPLTAADRDGDADLGQNDPPHGATPEAAATPEPAAPPESAEPAEPAEPAAAEATEPAAEPEPGEAETANGQPDQTNQSDPSDQAPSPTPAAPAAAPLTEPQQVERHFQEHHFDQIYRQVRRAVLPGDITAGQLAPGLLTLLADTLADLRRHPRDLIGPVQAALARRHLQVFRWDNRLHVALARPHPLPADTNLAERPARILDALRSGKARTLADLWRLLAPAETAASAPAQPPTETPPQAGPSTAASATDPGPAPVAGPANDDPSPAAAPAASEPPNDEKAQGQAIDPVAPTPAPSQPTAAWLADLHWLLTQGHVMLLPDNRLMLPAQRPGGATETRPSQSGSPSARQEPSRRGRSRRRKPRDRSADPQHQARPPKSPPATGTDSPSAASSPAPGPPSP